MTSIYFQYDYLLSEFWDVSHISMGFSSTIRIFESIYSCCTFVVCLKIDKFKHKDLWIMTLVSSLYN